MRIRFAERREYARMVEILNSTAPTPVTEADLVRQDELRALDGPAVRMVLETEAGLVACGRLFVDNWRPAGAMNVTVTVDSACGGQGYGTRLLGAMEAQARSLGATALESSCRDDRPADRAWAEGRGYSVIDRYFRSILDLDTFNPAPFAETLGAAEAAGYRFVRLAEVDGPEARQRLYEMDMECAWDEPGINRDPWPPLSLEEYQRQMFSAPVFDPAAVVIAVKGDEWAGFSGLHFPEGKDLAWVSFTGVRRPHRGQGLALALKLLAGRQATVRGRLRIGTTNNERNPAMLAVNRKLGFMPEPGFYILQKRV